MTVAALHGADAVVHLAANPKPDSTLVEGAGRFYGNTMSTYNIFNAATLLGIKRVVWASSETVLGLPFVDPPPNFAPVDESHTYPNSSYALSKAVCEEMARQFYRWSGTSFVGLRFSNIMNGMQAYERFPGFWDDAHINARATCGAMSMTAMWPRRVARALRPILKARKAFIIAAGDTVMTRPSRDLMAEVYPNVPVRDLTHDYGTLESNEKAKGHAGLRPTALVA